MSVDADALTSAAENALRASRLEPETLENLKAQYETAAKVVGAAGWHGPLDIQTLEGLEGQYLWPEDPFNFRVINFHVRRRQGRLSRQVQADRRHIHC